MDANKRIRMMRDTIDSLTKENAALRKRVGELEDTYTETEEAFIEYRELIRELIELKAEYQTLIREAQVTKREYDSKFKKLLRNVR